MKKYLLVLVGLCCVLSYALAERPDYPELKKSDANIIGHVLDKKTKEHLPYITIALKGTTIGTVTDATGHYFLKNLPEGNFILEVSSVGYKTVTRNVTLKKGKTLVKAGAAIVGGCCGTTEKHIKALSDATRGMELHRPLASHRRILASERKNVEVGLDGNFLVVGERINPTGKKKLQAQLREGKLILCVRWQWRRRKTGQPSLTSIWE